MHSTISTIIMAAIFAIAAEAQNCGPPAGGAQCAPGVCCSVWNWCGTLSEHCRSDCLPEYSGPGSPCRGEDPEPPFSLVTKTTKTMTTTSSATKTYLTVIPSIDVCGPGAETCPGAGAGGYFYRCCSSNGHCGPKNNIQLQKDYCGGGCQPGFGVDCDSSRALPPNPTGPKGVSGPGENCGPIVNKRCGGGSCCSGSNYCGFGDEFCGAANWCQREWGVCK